MAGLILQQCNPLWAGRMGVVGLIADTARVILQAVR